MSTELQRIDLLHAIRLRGLIGTAELSRSLGVAEERLYTWLSAERDDGLIVAYEGRLAGWALTTLGRSEGERLLAAELGTLGAVDAVSAYYDDFLVVNNEVLQLCSRWQVITVGGMQVANDHRDSDHDQQVLDQLSALNSAVSPLIARLAGASVRFEGYQRRLDAALSRVLAGETDWFTRSTIDSYHSVWFELHENLLAHLGRQRAAEPPGQ